MLVLIQAKKGDTMNFCKKCNCHLDSINTDSKDSRYCISCANAQREFLKRRRNLLQILYNLPLEIKIEKSKRIIQEAVNEFGLDHVYISYSGGKDSTVLSHIAKKLYPDILHIFANTTCEYPETIQHIHWETNENHTNLITVLPKSKDGNTWTFKKLVEHYGYPVFSKRISNAIRTYQHALSPVTKQHSIDYINRNFKKYDKYKELPISDKCCEILKKNPIQKKAKELGMECSILGILASESRQRERDWLKYGCNAFHKKTENQCRPLAFWTEKDIYEYIQKYNIKISHLYDLGYERNGCMYCAFGANLEKSPNRFQRLKYTHPTQHSYLVRNFGELLKSFDIEIE